MRDKWLHIALRNLNQEATEIAADNGAVARLMVSSLRVFSTPWPCSPSNRALAGRAGGRAHAN